MDLDRIEDSRDQVIKILNDSITKLSDQKPVDGKSKIRWELASCWVQHLQQKENDDKSSKEVGTKKSADVSVKGLGKEFKSLKKRENKSLSDGNEGTYSEVSDLKPDEGLSTETEATRIATGVDLEKLM